MRSKTGTTTSVEVSFTFNNNLEPSEKEAQMEIVADIVALEEDDIILLEEEKKDVALGADRVLHLSALGDQVKEPRFTDVQSHQEAAARVAREELRLK